MTSKSNALYQRLLKFDDGVVLAANITVADARHSFAVYFENEKADEAAGSCASDKGTSGGGIRTQVRRPTCRRSAQWQALSTNLNIL